MNTITMKVLLETLEALTAARAAILLSNAPHSAYLKVLNAESSLRVTLKLMQEVEVVE